MCIKCFVIAVGLQDMFFFIQTMNRLLLVSWHHNNPRWKQILISNGSKTYWSPIRSKIIRMITKLDDCTAESDLLITSLISERIG